MGTLPPRFGGRCPRAEGRLRQNKMCGTGMRRMRWMRSMRRMRRMRRREEGGGGRRREEEEEGGEGGERQSRTITKGRGKQIQ